jgi:subtilisin family serine protease
MMTRWGLLALLGLTACGTEEEPGTSVQYQVCPGVVAGALPDQATQALSSAPTADGRQRYLVRYRDMEQVGTHRVATLGGQVRRVYRTVPGLAALLTAEERDMLARDPMVLAIEPDVRLRPQSLPRPATLTQLSGPEPIGSTSEYTAGLNLVQAPQVWDADLDGQLDVNAPNGSGIKVCVIDSGIDPDHPELKQRYLAGKDFVDDDDAPWDRFEETWGYGHGTHVAGTIAAQLGSGSVNVGPEMHRNGVVGVAPGVQLLIARVLDIEGNAWMSDVLSALEWCQSHEAKIASLSLGGPVDTQLERDAFAAAAANGMLVIAAAGNSGGPLAYPAAYPSVLAVGAVDASVRRAFFSSRGDNLGVMAPGVDVVSTIIQDQGTVSQVALGDIRLPSRSIYQAPAGTHSGKLVDCGDGSTLSSCREATCDGFVAYVNFRHEVPLPRQIANVMMQGARAVVIGDSNHPGGLMDLSIGRPGAWVPSALVSHSSGSRLKAALGHTTHVQLLKSDYAPFSGTSMAAPHVTGVAALVWSARPGLKAAQVRQLLETTAKDLGPAGRDRDTGFGLVQARAALQALEALP